MTTPPSFVSNDHRDRCICWLQRMHPLTARTLVSLRWFRRKREARACLRRLAAMSRIHQVGTIRHWLVRSEHVFCGWRPHRGHLSRELQLTEIFLRLHAGEIRRGPFVSDQLLQPDAQFWINGQVHYLELDRGPADPRPIAERLPAYGSCPHPCLWVCATEERAEALRRSVKTFRGNHRFTTVAQALANPHAEVWHDISGSRALLRREANSPENGSGTGLITATDHWSMGAATAG